MTTTEIKYSISPCKHKVSYILKHLSMCSEYIGLLCAVHIITMCHSNQSQQIAILQWFTTPFLFFSKA